MSEVAVQQLSPGVARVLTDEVKRDAETLWLKLVELYEGGAHLALKYSSWGDYFQAEFGGSRAYGYRLLDAGRVLDVVQQSPIGDSRPANEAQARELSPLLDQPEELKEAWAEVIAITENPTAADVKTAVDKRRRLSDEQKTEVVTRYIGGERQIDIANALHVSQSLVSSVIRAAKKEAGESVPTRRAPLSPQSKIIKEIQDATRRWESLEPEEWLNVSEAARRARVLEDVIEFLKQRRETYAFRGGALLKKGSR